MRLFGKRLGIDLGTVNTRISLGGRIVLDEPSVVAVDEREGDVLAVGSEAYRMLGRTPGNVKAVNPLQNGVIADFGLTEKMLGTYIRRVLRRGITKPSIVVGVTSGSTSVEKRAMVDVLYNIGAKEVHLVEGPLAAAVGAGLPIWDPSGLMLVDIGGGTTDVVVVALGSVVRGTSVKVAGCSMDDAIANHIKRMHNILIGSNTASEVKVQLGSTVPTGQVMTVCGQHVVSGLPTTVDICADELQPVIKDVTGDIIGAIKNTLERTPPELAADILARGIILTGGGSMLKGLDRLIASEVGLPTQVAEDPSMCVVRGAGAVSEAVETYKRVITRQKKLA